MFYSGRVSRGMLYFPDGTTGTKRKERIMVQHSLGTRLRVLRAERGLTLRAAEELTGVARETIGEVERDLRKPHDLTLAKIAAGYGVPFESLLELEEVEASKAEAGESARQEEKSARELARDAAQSPAQFRSPESQIAAAIRMRFTLDDLVQALIESEGERFALMNEIDELKQQLAAWSKAKGARKAREHANG
jgi:transcriptional regulator with XRE-family HTH domain